MLNGGHRFAFERCDSNYPQRLNDSSIVFPIHLRVDNYYYCIQQPPSKVAGKDFDCTRAATIEKQSNKTLRYLINFEIDIMKKYKLVAKKGEGTFSEVVEAESIENGKFYAIKCMKKSFKSLQQVCKLSIECMAA